MTKSHKQKSAPASSRDTGISFKKIAYTVIFVLAALPVPFFTASPAQAAEEVFKRAPATLKILTQGPAKNQIPSPNTFLPKALTRGPNLPELAKDPNSKKTGPVIKTGPSEEEREALKKITEKHPYLSPPPAP